MISLNGQDLAQVFSPILPSLTIKVPDGNFYYSYTTTDGYTVVIFAEYTSPPTSTTPPTNTTNIGYDTVTGITVSFNSFFNNPVYVTTVGGGGAGGNGWYGYGSVLKTMPVPSFYEGGGGGGGGVNIIKLSPSSGQLYNITVGCGGNAYNSDIPDTPKRDASSSSLMMNGNTLIEGGGGSSGGDAISGSVGTGGPGGYPYGSNGGNGKTPGTNSLKSAIYPNTLYEYYFGGGGSGLGGTCTQTSCTGDGGGLGGGGSLWGGNDEVPYEGPNSIYYVSIDHNGYPGVGGGGGGGQYGSYEDTIGGKGGSGVVILCYKTLNP